MTGLPSPTAVLPGGLVAALRPLDAASPLLPAWRGLARAALVDNLFFEPDFALAAGAAFGAGVHVLVVCDRPPEAPGARCLALWPCRVERRWGLPLPVLIGWTHGFSIFGAPLVDAGDPDRALAALLYEAPRALGLPPRLMLPYLPLDGPFARALDRARARSGGRIAWYWEHARGVLDLGAQDAAPPAAPSPRRARQLARLSRRMAAAAPVSHETVAASAALGPALDDFVALEAAGWKGRAGSAVGQRPREVAFLHALVRAYGARGEARIDRLVREGRSLAVSLGIRTGATWWYLKIAHDEAEARNSPGAQLVRRVTAALLADPSLRLADSCAPPGFALIESAWRGRLRLGHGLIEAGRDPWFPLAVRLEGLRAGAGRLCARLSRR